MAEILYHPRMQASDPTRPLDAQYLNALLYGGKCLGYREVTFSNGAAIALPEILAAMAGANAVIIYLEAAAADVNKPRVARYREDGVDPTAAIGMPLGDDGILEISGRANVEAFRIIGISAEVQTIRIQYYGQA